LDEKHLKLNKSYDMKYTIGIDIGGTNTDAVIVDNNGKILAAIKVPTTKEVHIGLKAALTEVLQKSAILPHEVATVAIGTTHATNALLQENDLYRVGLIRVAGHKPDTLPPCLNWAESLRDKVFAGCITVNGGYECDGREITSLEPDEVKSAISKLIEMGAEAIAVVGVFSPLYHSQEQIIGEMVREMLGANFPCTLSYKIGGIGIIERENASILNSSLTKALTFGFQHISQVLEELQLTGQVYITQNNGTLITVDEALKFPIKTISSGQTNSFIGAGKLAKKDNAIIIDIGGTSSDCGIILNKFPRRTLNNSKIGGVMLNFPMPDVISIALGGGSIVNERDFSIEPKSVARELLSRAKSFGGDCLTLTDIALAAGKMTHVKQKMVVDAPCDDILKGVAQKIDQLANKIHKENLPLVIVGGGAVLIDKQYSNCDIIIPDNFAVANAYGAALAEFSASYDNIISLDQREQTLQNIKSNLLSNLIALGVSSESARIIDQVIIPFHYIPGNMARVIITAAGRSNSL
jgi:N-methylhydantoinase A/oxoprolinase/acetone carboxylase beta subunit